MPTTDVHLTIPRDIEGSQVATMLDKEKKKEKVKIMVVAKQQQPIPPKTTVQPLPKTAPTPTPPQTTPKKTDGSSITLPQKNYKTTSLYRRMVPLALKKKPST
ncbi:MAG: hypothetical protein HXX20_23305 [Chloroflexi bacterium]|nr:hypothetical protein [Chloroflexota bacterium]